MANLQIEAKAAAVMKKLKKLGEVVDDPGPTLEKVGEKLAASTRRRFYTNKSPTGKPWRQSKRARKRHRRTLVDTGYLRDSITFKTGGKQVAIGTNVWYAPILQKGGRIDATYKRKSGRTRGASIPKVPNFSASASSAQALLKSVQRRATRGARQAAKAARNVRLPARRFLGVSKKDRKNVTDVV